LKVSGIIAAAGGGTRMGAGKNKVFLDVLGIPMLAHTLKAFESARNIDDIIVVTGKNDIEKVSAIAEKYNITKFSKAVSGGAERQESVMNGLYATDADIVAVHDGARALIEVSTIERCVEDAKKYKAASVGVKCIDSLKMVKNGFIQSTVERENIYNIQTPQVFFRDILLSCHEKAAREHIKVTDDTALVQAGGIDVFITEGSYENIKITTPVDIVIAEEILKRRKNLCV
jgi:2-C-methyl-D-erythritol 4-phosphate cytidylyltransferase